MIFAYVHCRECGIATRSYALERTAIEVWNRRVKERTFEDILYMIIRSCDKNFYKGTDYDGLKPEIVRCATNIYIEQMRQNGGKENE